MAFLDSMIFPTDISRGSVGGPRWATEIAITDGGYEERNQPWSYPLYDFDVGYGARTVAQLESLVAAFNVAQGMTQGFRYQDFFDYKSCVRDDDPAFDDQVLIASAVGGETTAQLLKTYSSGGGTLARKITRPFGSVLVGKNGSALTYTTDYTVDLTTGVVTLTSALVATDMLTAGFTYHVPVRFNSNNLPVNLQDLSYGSTSATLTELRE